MNFALLPFATAFAASLVILFTSGSARNTPEPDRSPCDIALTQDGRFALTANRTSGSCSLVDLREGRVLAEAKTGGDPFAVALSRDGTLALVSNWRDETVSLLQVSNEQLRILVTIEVGYQPRGVVFAPTGRRAFVALAGEDAVLEIDVEARKVARRVDVGQEPWRLALAPDGTTLTVGNTLSQNVSFIDTKTMTVIKTVRTRGRNIRHLEVSADGVWVYLPAIAEVGVPVTKGNIDNGWIVASRLCRLPVKEDGPREAIALDPRGKAVADVDGLALAPSGKGLALSASGTHEIVALGYPLPFESYGGPADHINPSLLADSARFRRIPVGGRPMGLRYMPGGNRVAVANYLLNAVQIVDLDKAAVEKTISLGGPTTPSQIRKGEAIFYDAERSFNQWYSCGSCHTEGHTGGGSFDTFNDGSYRTLKKTLSLRGIARTGPWTWHGHRETLKELVRDSMLKSMQGPEPSPEDLDALTAYVASIPFAPAPKIRNAAFAAAVKRGEKLFKARACDTCHAAPDYTSSKSYPVGLESAADVFPGFNPPPLRGVGTRPPYLHDGRADTLEEVLGKHHTPSKLTGKADFTSNEMADVVAFLKSL